MDMPQSETEQRMAERRTKPRGGRRSTDPPAKPTESPSCPACGANGSATEAGAADGGWWFVCAVCDHLWDERKRRQGTA